MAATLQWIWSATPEALERLHHNQGLGTTTILGYDRVNAAMIYSDLGLLGDSEAKLVQHPKFSAVMVDATTALGGIEALQRYIDFTIQFLVLHVSLWAIEDNALMHAHNLSTHDTIDKAFRAISTEEDWEAGKTIAYGLSAKATIDIACVEYEVAKTIPHEIWSIIIGENAKLVRALSKLPFETKDFDPHQIIRDLLAVDITTLLSIGQRFYLYSIWKLLQLFPNVPLIIQLETGPHKDLFTSIPLVFTTELDPLTSGLGGQVIDELRNIIGAYAAQTPTNEEVYKRI